LVNNCNAWPADVAVKFLGSSIFLRIWIVGENRSVLVSSRIVKNFDSIGKIVSEEYQLFELKQTQNRLTFLSLR